MNALDIDKLRAHVAGLPGGGLDAIRQQAVAALARTGLPSTRDEAFKYTDLSEIGALSRAWLEQPTRPPISAEAARRIDEVTATGGIDWLVIANGDLNAVLARPAGPVSFERLSESLHRPRPASALEPLTALNAALLEDGLVIRVDASPEQPLGLLVIDDAGDAPGLSQLRIDIEVAAGQSLEFVEYYLSTGEEAHYSNAVLQLDLREGSSARHLRLQDRDVRHSQTQRLDVRLERDAAFTSASFDLGGRLTRNDLNVDLTSPGSSAEFSGLYLSADGQHVDNHTRVDHRTGPTVSRQEYRGILFGRSRAVWNGKAMVHEGADGTGAQQANHNLLLSEHAEIDTKPELEIYAEDVRCAHGTTVGQLDDRALFYLRSRGLDADDARRLLVHAFAAEILSAAPIDAIAPHLEALLDTRLTAIDDVSLSV